jgi:phosphoglycolate phosphatase
MYILFDLDGTLIDSTEAILESFSVAFEENSLEPRDSSDVERLIGYPLDVMFSELGARSDLVAQCVESYKKHYRVISKQKTTLLPNAKEAIELASSFAKLGVVTTKTARYSRELLEHFEVMHYFEILIGREDVINPKPHPEPILKAIDLMGANINKTFMIGDTNLDTVSAKEANIKSLGVLSGYDSNLKADWIFQDSLEAILYLKSTIS